MEVNTARRDNRLNFFGKAVVLPGDEEPNCYQSDCSMDHDCEADRKCCRNNCGALVCTAAGIESNSLRNIVNDTPKHFWY